MIHFLSPLPVVSVSEKAEDDEKEEATIQSPKIDRHAQQSPPTLSIPSPGRKLSVRSADESSKFKALEDEVAKLTNRVKMLEYTFAVFAVLLVISIVL
jgi:hypothetical protein